MYIHKCRTGVIEWLLGTYWRPSTEVLRELFSNQELLTYLVSNGLAVCSSPHRYPFIIHALSHLHYQRCGGFYPVGGGSEFPMNIIPVIRKHGGKVLVNAMVREILFESGKATGVLVTKKTGKNAPSRTTGKNFYFQKHSTRASDFPDFFTSRESGKNLAICKSCIWARKRLKLSTF